MPFYRVGNFMVHLKLAGKASRKPPAACRARQTWSNNGIAMHHCCGISTALCDWPVGDKTCDMPLCLEHATEVGPDRHYCPVHMAKHREANPELFP
jgi:hypothetical protein